MTLLCRNVDHAIICALALFFCVLVAFDKSFILRGIKGSFPSKTLNVILHVLNLNQVTLCLEPDKTTLDIANSLELHLIKAWLWRHLWHIRLHLLHWLTVHCSHLRLHRLDRCWHRCWLRRSIHLWCSLPFHNLILKFIRHICSAEWTYINTTW